MASRPAPPAKLHLRVRTTAYPLGWVAWCSCGCGSPAKPTQEEANASLGVHLLDPRKMPT